MDWIPLFGVIPVACWLLAAISALELALKHPLDGLRTIDYAFKGHLFFNEENFAHTGAAAYRRMGIGALGFVLSTGLLVTAAAVFQA